MTDFPQNNDYGPGTWKGLGDGLRRTASFTCKNGHVCSLDKHTIGMDGDVFPSLRCPYEGCDFHEMLTLKGWADTYPCRICQNPVGPDGQFRVAIVAVKMGDQTIDVTEIKSAFCKTHWDAMAKETGP